MGNKEKKGIKNSWIKKIIKLLVIVLTSFIGLLIIASVLFYIYRDTIGREILLRVNNYQKGEVSFTDVALTPFVHFPSISLRLKNVTYTVETLQDSILMMDTIAVIGKLYVAIDISDLLAGEVNVSSLTLANGTIALKMSQDSSLNLIRAMSSPDTDIRISDTTTRVFETDTSSGTGMNIALEGIHLKNIRLYYHHFADKDTLQAEILSMKASLNYQDGNMGGHVALDSRIDKVKILAGKSLSDLPMNINADFSFDENQQRIDIGDGNLQLSEANFRLQGYSVLGDNPEIDISVSGHDKNIGFLGFWLSETGLKNLKSGSPYFTGTIKGSLKENLPEMEFDFGMRDVNIYLPSVDNEISDLNFEGSFSSGLKPDLSQASFTLNKLSGKMPGGFLNAKLEVKDFSQPKIVLLWDMEADITGFDEILNIDGVNGLRGRISLHDRFQGMYDITSGDLIEDHGESSLLLDSVCVELPDFLGFENICGELHRSMDTLIIDSLRLFAGNSDFFITGDISNYLSFLEEEESEILADLHIISDTFDLPVFCAFDPNVGKNFPYQIIDIDLNVHASTTQYKLLDFYSNPAIDFNINHLNATIHNLFPPVSISHGIMYMTEKEKRVHLDFKEFDLEIVDSKIHTDVLYASPPQDPDFVGVDANILGLNPSRIFYSDTDSIPGVLDGILNGSIKTDMKLGLDTNVFESLDVISSQLDYTTRKDTFDVKVLSLSGQHIHYKGDETPFATMTADFELRIDDIKSNHFEVENIAFDIQADDGVFTVHPERMQFFGKEGKGIYILKPFKEIPSYELKYQISNFRIENFLSNLMADTLLTGNMNLDLDVVLTEFNEDKPLTGINGFVNMEANDLTLYGLDLDNLIRKFQRSQKFNLVDVGAVLLAGPFGLAISKGSEFASLAFGDYGETTHVVELNSEWDCTNGMLKMTDVALATDENRIACSGWIDLPADSLNITFAVLDKNGCSILSQSIYGPLENPEYSELKIVSTILAPVTNLIDGALGKDCEPFYTGKIKHPSRKKKQ